MYIRERMRRKQAAQELSKLVARLRPHPDGWMICHRENDIAKAKATIAISYLASEHVRRGLVADEAWADALRRTMDWANVNVPIPVALRVRTEAIVPDAKKTAPIS
jgi:hypothetical protein